MTFKIEISFMIKVKQNQTFFKYDIIFHCSQNTKIFQ